MGCGLVLEGRGRVSGWLVGEGRRMGLGRCS